MNIKKMCLNELKSLNINKYSKKDKNLIKKRIISEKKEIENFAEKFINSQLYRLCITKLLKEGNENPNGADILETASKLVATIKKYENKKGYTIL